MPYHKDKQQSFQAAQQSMNEAEEVYENIVKDGANYGQQLKHLKREVNEAFAQIENALENASEKQRKQLERYRDDLSTIVDEVNLYE